MFDELYALAYFNDEGNFVCYVRKGRNNAITGYDSLTSAKRGLVQSRAYTRKKENIRIVVADRVTVVEEVE